LLKAVGAIIILFAATMIGFQAANLYAERPKEIRRLIIGLQLLDTEIYYSQLPLQQALFRVARRLRGVVGVIFQTAGEYLKNYDGLSTTDCWELAVSKTWNKTTMRKPEKEVFLTLGRVLGRSDKQDQQKHLRLAIMNLQSEEQEAKFDAQKYEKMYKSLGFLSGLLAVILMY
jgi:stage III sporulation protein AB